MIRLLGLGFSPHLRDDKVSLETKSYRTKAILIAPRLKAKLSTNLKPLELLSTLMLITDSKMTNSKQLGATKPNSSR